MPHRLSLPLAIVLLAACSSPVEVARTSGVTASATASSAASTGGGAEATATGPAFAYAKTLNEAGGGTMEFSYSWPAEAAAEPKLAAMLKQKLDTDFAETKTDWERSSADCPKDAISCRNNTLDSRYKVVANVPDYLSLSNLVSTYTGGAHGIYAMETLVWDRKTQAALNGIDLFRSPAALGSAIGPALCEALNAERTKKGMERIERDGGTFAACPAIDEATVLVGSANGRSFDRITVWYGPYVAGSYAEGAYELDFPVTARMLDAVKPQYRAAFSVGR